MSKGLHQGSAPGKDDLVLNQAFTYEFFEKHRYKISEQGEYEALCNNGFTKLYSKLCRVYWHAQNQFGHEVKDWKFHISVKHQHLRRAWNLVAALFFKMKCRAGMKAIYLKQAQHPHPGREITVYLIKYDQHFKDSAFSGDFGLDISIQHSQEYWLQFCTQVQSLLQLYGIESNGTAEGDCPLGKYVSLRNEAFVSNKYGQQIYPPDNMGWNPLRHQVPIHIDKFRTAFLKLRNQNDSSFDKYRPFLIAGMTFVSAFLFLKYKKSLPQ